jgi:hypothetical protein
MSAPTVEFEVARARLVNTLTLVEDVYRQQACSARIIFLKIYDAIVVFAKVENEEQSNYALRYSAGDILQLARLDAKGKPARCSPEDDELKTLILQVFKRLTGDTDTGNKAKAWRSFMQPDSSAVLH